MTTSLCKGTEAPFADGFFAIEFTAKEFFGSFGLYHTLIITTNALFYQAIHHAFV